MSELRERFDRIGRRARQVAAVAGVLTAAGALLDRGTFYQAWLVSFLYWLALPLGSLALVMLHHLTGGSWGLAIRRLLEASMRTLPVFVLLFLPLAFGLRDLYPWSDPAAVAADPVLQAKAPYLNTGSFLLRAALYFGLWIGLSTLLNRMSARYDRSGDRAQVRRMRAVSGPGIVVYALCVTFASVDWAMSLEPHWFSTIYGVMFVVGQGLATLAFAVVVSAWLSRREPFSRWLTADHFHDLGKLLFAFVMLWAYVAFSQYLIIWSANLSEETPWYVHRTGHGWDAVAKALVALHFALPFLALLSRRAKRNVAVLARIALGLLALRLVDLYWLVIPAFHPDGVQLHWLHLTTPVALGGLWISLFVGQLKGRPLISLQDAHLEAALEAGADLPHAGGAA